MRLVGNETNRPNFNLHTYRPVADWAKSSGSCAQAAGRPANIVHYDPKAAGVDAKKAFPFRNMHFYAEPRAAKEILGWKSTTNLAEDLKERFGEYLKIGRDKKANKFELDDKILESSKVPVAV